METMKTPNVKVTLERDACLPNPRRVVVVIIHVPPKRICALRNIQQPCHPRRLADGTKLKAVAFCQTPKKHKLSAHSKNLMKADTEVRFTNEGYRGDSEDDDLIFWFTLRVREQIFKAISNT